MTFYRQLAALTLGCAFVLSALALSWPPLSAHLVFTLGSVAFYAVLTIAIYVSARAAAAHKNQARLAQYVMVLTFVKMAVSLAVVMGYYYIARPTTKAFLLPFFVAYFAFTIYETVVLLKLNKSIRA